MEREDVVWYDNQFELFSTQGWKDFINKAEEIYEAYNDVSNIQTEDQLMKVKGVLENLRWVTSWEQVVNDTYKILSRE